MWIFIYECLDGHDRENKRKRRFVFRHKKSEHGEVSEVSEQSPNVDMARLSYGLMAALLVACSFTTLVYADVQIGEITVSDTAARYDGVSEAVCEIFAAMDFEPYDWYDDDEFVECL